MEMRYGHVGGKRSTREIYPKVFADNIRGVPSDLHEFVARQDSQMTLGLENVSGFRYDRVYPFKHQALGGKLCLTFDTGHIRVWQV